MPKSKPLSQKCFVQCKHNYFTCAQCDKTYNNKAGLIIHNKYHHKGENRATRNSEDNFPFYCAPCKMEFQYDFQMKAHSQKFHKGCWKATLK